MCDEYLSCKEPRHFVYYFNISCEYLESKFIFAIKIMNFDHSFAIWPHKKSPSVVLYSGGGFCGLCKIFHDLNILLGMIREIAALAVGGDKVYRGVGSSHGKAADRLLQTDML